MIMISKHSNLLSDIDEQTILKTIDTLPTKNSSGFDGISTKLF